MKVTKASLGIRDLHFSNSPARRHTKKQLRKAVNMFAEQSIISPIVVDRSYRIIDGHLRGWCQTNQLKHQKPWERGFYEAIRERHSVRAESRLSLNEERFESNLCELNRL